MTFGDHGKKVGWFNYCTTFDLRLTLRVKKYSTEYDRLAEARYKPWMSFFTSPHAQSGWTDVVICAWFVTIPGDEKTRTEAKACMFPRADRLAKYLSDLFRLDNGNVLMNCWLVKAGNASSFVWLQILLNNDRCGRIIPSKGSAAGYWL